MVVTYRTLRNLEIRAESFKKGWKAFEMKVIITKHKDGSKGYRVHAFSEEQEDAAERSDFLYGVCYAVLIKNEDELEENARVVAIFTTLKDAEKAVIKISRCKEGVRFDDHLFNKDTAYMLFDKDKRSRFPSVAPPPRIYD